MPCFLAIALMGLPRLALLLVWLLTDYTKTAFDSVIWPILGFFFMPITTLCYMWASNATGHRINGPWIFLVVLGVLLDLGLVGSARRKKRRRK